MRRGENMNHFVSEDTITLYWDKKASEMAKYRIFVNENEHGVTGKTHYKLEDLESEKEYFIRIEKIKEEAATVFAELTLTTGKAKRKIDITQAPYYAIGDGVTLNTEKIQRAIDACGAMDTVYIPAGVFLTGALRLHSDMELYLDEGGVLQGTDEVKDYLPMIWSRFEGTERECYSSLLNLGSLHHDRGYQCQNVVIRGKGTIASGGQSLAQKVITSEQERLKAVLESLKEQIKEYEKPETIPGRVRPRLINMSNCRNIVLSGLTLKNGASWNVHMIYSDSIVTEGCTFYSEGVWNGDGWDPDSSTNCTIFNCTFFTGDDSIAIKSGKNPEGNQIARPCAKIRIFDCRCAFGHGIAIGSEISGGIEDIAIWDCDMTHSEFGIEIKGTKKRGGYVRNVSVFDSSTSRILFHSVGYNDDGIAAPTPPVFENCRFEHVSITGEFLNWKREWLDCEALELCGFEQADYELRNIRCSHLVLGQKGKRRKHTIAMALCQNISFENITVL